MFFACASVIGKAKCRCTKLFQTVSHNFGILFLLDKGIDEVIDTRNEGLGRGFSIAVDNVVIDLAGALKTTEGDLFDGFIEFSFGSIKKGLKKLDQFLFLEWR